MLHRTVPAFFPPWHISCWKHGKAHRFSNSFVLNHIIKEGGNSMKANKAATIAATIFFLFMGFSSLSASDSTSNQNQQAIHPTKTAEDPEKMASSHNLPVVTLPEVVCKAKKMSPLFNVQFGKKMKAIISSIEMPKIQMVNFSTIANEIWDRLK